MTALLIDGCIVAAAQQERFSRKKHDAGFPADAIKYCLDEAGLKLENIDHVVFYDKPLLKFERPLETYLAYAPKGFRSFVAAMPIWLKEKLFLKTTLRRELAALSGNAAIEIPALLFSEHHEAHAASAFFPSPFSKAAVLCLDGVGEWATTSVWLGENNHLTPQWEIDFPHSLGLLYSAFTYYTGFRVNSGEYKLMGLAPYGEPLVASPGRLPLFHAHRNGLSGDGEYPGIQVRPTCDRTGQGMDAGIQAGLNMQSNNNTEMRKFGFMMGAIIALLFGLLLPWLFGHDFPLWPWIIAAVFWLAATAAPAILVPVHSAWLRIGHALGWLNTRIILGLMFYTVFFVVAIVMKLLGYDPMSRKLDHNLDSYRVPSNARARDHLEKPF